MVHERSLIVELRNTISDHIVSFKMVHDQWRDPSTVDFGSAVNSQTPKILGRVIELKSLQLKYSDFH